MKSPLSHACSDLSRNDPPLSHATDLSHPLGPGLRNDLPIPDVFHIDVPCIGVSVCIAIGVAFGAGPALTALQCAFDLFVPPLTV
jgi:hypothetical protein